MPVFTEKSAVEDRIIEGLKKGLMCDLLTGGKGASPVPATGGRKR
jgi:hypothetical protein